VKAGEPAKRCAKLGVTDGDADGEGLATENRHPKLKPAMVLPQEQRLRQP